MKGANPSNSYLPGWGVNRDHEGGSPRARPFHCTPVGLTPAISPNVGNSTALFVLVGICVRANPCKINRNKIEDCNMNSILEILFLLRQRCLFLQCHITPQCLATLGLGSPGTAVPSREILLRGCPKPRFAMVSQVILFFLISVYFL